MLYRKFHQLWSHSEQSMAKEIFRCVHEPTTLNEQFYVSLSIWINVIRSASWDCFFPC